MVYIYYDRIIVQSLHASSKTTNTLNLSPLQFVFCLTHDHRMKVLRIMLVYYWKTGTLGTYWLLKK